MEDGEALVISLSRLDLQFHRGPQWGAVYQCAGVALMTSVRTTLNQGWYFL